jgi:hypothetical protein
VGGGREVLLPLNRVASATPTQKLYNRQNGQNGQMNAPGSPPQPPSSFDPAIHLHSEQAENEEALLGPQATFSDDIDGLNAVLQESAARKNEQGIVIQHRAWRTVEVFRSEDDNFLGSGQSRRHSYAR